MTKQFSSVQAAVDAIRLGKVVIVVDAEDRENEGDFICAAQTVTTETINFMLRGRGQLCAPILPSTSERLELRPIVQDNTAPLQTAFMTPVDYFGSKTGITAAERAETIRRLASDTSMPHDFVRPGHVYPLLAMEGGVLRRAGHTEAAVDLARMAGLAPAGVLTEILDDSGDRATRDGLLELAELHSLEIISIEQLIAHRRVNEKLVNRVAQAHL
ncbi:MAG: 3,4-dihydroxy-2-butanone-4-phosphate synthase, partial [Planctomycetales bacterium 12-60-4]